MKMTTAKIFKEYDWKDITNDIDWKTGSYEHQKGGEWCGVFSGTKSRFILDGFYVKFKDVNCVGFINVNFLIFKKRAYVLYLKSSKSQDEFINNMNA